MKKIISILISVAMLANVFSIIAMSEETTHWADEEINYLLSKNVIAGDDNGIRPDDLITRAEFAKVLNKNMNYKDISGENFNDVSNDDWYYNDMLIAKNKGYFKGDDIGNSNPTSNLSRIEACVVYARLLNLSLNAKEFNFKDGAKIEDWAKPYVNALVESRIIVGYGDGEFKPNNFMTRAEVFSTVVRVENYSYEHSKDNNSNDNNEATYNPPIISGSGGGSSSSGGSSGGGGGGGTTIPNAPSISNVDTKNMIVSWNNVSGASSYTLNLKRVISGATKEIKNIKSNSCNINKEVSELIGSDKEAVEKFTVSVSSNGTKFSKEFSFDLEYETVKIPENTAPVLAIEDGKQVLKLTWDAAADVKLYEVYVMVDNVETKIITTTNELVFPDNIFLTGKQTIKVKTISNNPNLANSALKEITIDFPLFGGGDGEKATPYLIYNGEQFKNISKDSSKAFLLKKDVVLTNYAPIEVFKGVLDGGGNKIEINLVDENKETVGLIKTLDGGTVKSLEVTGALKAKNFVGGICANSTNNAVLEDLINSIDIEVLDVSSKWSGGIVGDAKQTTIKNCINKGNLTFKGSMVGGVVGYLQSTSKIESGANLGNITGFNNVGGVIGAAYGNVENVYNAGEISGNSTIGGVIGFARPATGYIKYAFNTGDVIAENEAGGIIATINPSVAITLDELYNIGDVTSKTNNAGGVYSNKMSGTIGANVYYSTDCYYDLEKEDTNHKTLEEIKNLAPMSDKWHKILGFDYPQLKAIAYAGTYEEKNPLLEKATATIIYNGTQVNLKVTPVSNAVNYKIVVINSEGIEMEFETELEVDIISAMPSFGDYTITITSIADGINYRNSNIAVTTFTHKELGQLDTPANLKYEWLDDNNVETYKITWDEVFLAESYDVKVYGSGETPLIDTNVATNEFKLIEESKITYGADYRVVVKAVSSKPENNSLENEITFGTLFASGNGTDSSPFGIKNLRHLNLMISRNDTMVYSLENDITLPNDYAPMATFSGNLRGKITNDKRPSIDFGTRTGVTSFGFVGTLKGKISNIEFLGSLSGTTKIGVVAHELSSATALIDNCLSKVTINATDTGSTGYVGGIVGRIVQGTVSNSRNEGAIITKGRHTGGIVGRIWGGSSALISTVTGCSNAGRIGNSNMLTGGIVGLSGQDKDLKTTITQCYNEGEIVATNALVGGILGGGYANISECYNKANISGTTNVAGISASLGYTTNAANEVELISKLEDCYNVGTITATGYGAGIVCSIRSAKIKNVYNIGTITAPNARPIAGILQPNKDTTQGNSLLNAYHDQYVEGNGTTLKTLEELKDISLFDSNVWSIEVGYDYPQLTNNKHKN